MSSLGSPNTHISLDLPFEKGLHIVKDHVLAGLHHGVCLSYTKVDTGSVYRSLALSRAFVFSSQLKVLLEVANRFLNQALLIVKKSKLKSCVSLSLGLILCLCDIHKFAQVMNGHLDVPRLRMYIRKELVGLTLLVS